ncbi:hypothetical protein [Papillibacter cinnamivorans]|uniref:Uncharacterized protein n=1 Tax=Papillibacter cinnamivorans DSM 12816 TaxID=1122930 RepID=A0A1W1YY90_9FIRM|nr:hypothetical protein [Papillibacter cinnamivorans]SMC41093.1 hypothetical protein SAMN02745168_0771 [Papillibacter cinnamivorans DSM 12816]
MILYALSVIAIILGMLAAFVGLMACLISFVTKHDCEHKIENISEFMLDMNETEKKTADCCAKLTDLVRKNDAQIREIFENMSSNTEPIAEPDEKTKAEQQKEDQMKKAFFDGLTAIMNYKPSVLRKGESDAGNEE